MDFGKKTGACLQLQCEWWRILELDALCHCLIPGILHVMPEQHVMTRTRLVLLCMQDHYLQSLNLLMRARYIMRSFVHALQ